ncbi:MAG: M48 family metallopeptidase [Chitinophagaceae bacterium]
MNYNATYYCNANEYPAMVTPAKDGLRIQFADGGREATVLWNYRLMAPAKTGAATFTYPGYPLQTLVVLQPRMAQSIQQKKEAQVRNRTRRRIARVFTFFAAFVGAVMMVYAFVLPWIAGLIAGSIPVEYEKSMGKQLYASVKGSYEVDEKRTAYVNSFFDEMKVPSAYNIHITVVKNEVPNAYAMPGGYIVVHDKLLDGLTSYPELAALLSHEFIHIENRHSLRSLFSSMSNYIFLSLILGDIGTVTAIVVSHTHHLKNLSYSRKLEKEADEEGVAILQERNIDCSGFVRLFRLLQKEAGEEPSEWVSSHPNLKKRIRNIQQMEGCRKQQWANNETLQNLFIQIQKKD